MIRKLGFRLDIPSEVAQAESILEDMSIVTVSVTESGDKLVSTWPQLCVMTSNITLEEFNSCLGLDPSI